MVALSLGVAGAAAQVADVPPAPPSPSPAPPLPDSGATPSLAAPAPAPPTAAAEPDVADNQVDQDEPANKVVAPVVPPAPARAQAAILRVLDKVTAETMAFEAPIGRRVRYKSLVFEVKTCVTRGAGDPLPQPSAYLLITSDAGASTGAVIGPRQVFKGWMFANAPGLHALKHPVYDAWLVACSAAAPAT
jgi:hypothetical protein